MGIAGLPACSCTGPKACATHRTNLDATLGPFIVPHLSYERIAGHAEAFITKHHPSREIPVPVEDIIDVQMQIDIVPIPGLTRVLSDDEDDGVESFVNSALTQIFVDKAAYDRQTNRYRFSIAHELGHIVLHPKVFAKLQVDSIEEWKRAVRCIPQKDYQWLEWQAYTFAGHLLVPARELADGLESCIARVKQEHMDPADEAVRPFIEKHLGDQFAVSSDVIHRRIDKERLWPSPRGRR